MYHVIVLLCVLFTTVRESLQIDFCDKQSLISNNVTSYKYMNEKVQNCNCKYKTTCIRKCCAVGFYASKGVCIRHHDPDFVLNIPVYQGRTFVRNVSGEDEILVGVMNCEFFTLRSNNIDDWFYLQENGKLTTIYGTFSNDYFCLESFKEGDLGVFFCYDTNETPREINCAGMIISMPFLLATFIAYALLPDRNLHMKALMFYVINLFCGYLLLVIIQLSDVQFGIVSCTLMGYFCLYFFMVSFFWMNVICIDIWFAFSGLRGFSGSKKLAERKRFYMYCCYAWGVPTVHVFVVYGIQTLLDENSRYNPGIGNGQCFFRRTYPELFYFYGPMGILITINIIFFAITAIKIRSVKKDTSVLKKEDSKRHTYENDKQTFNLYLKLLFAMGINWSMEIISWAMGWAEAAPSYVWYLTDFCNAIYGVFIFFIFVFKKNIWKLLKKRYYSFRGRPFLAHSIGSSNATRTTSYSTAHSLQDHHPHGGANDSTVLTSEA